MKRLGKFSGKIYSENDDYSSECCIIITDDNATDNSFIKASMAKNAMDCLNCHGCPESKK